MGERRLVALLKELVSLVGACLFYKHFTAMRFFSDKFFGGSITLDGLTMGSQRLALVNRIHPF
jgi:hypothetical protein